MPHAKRLFVIGILFATAASSMAEVPPISQEGLEAMPFKFRATVRSVDARPAGRTGCVVMTKFVVSLDNVVSLRESKLPQTAMLEGIGNDFLGCVGGSGARSLGKLKPGDEITVHAGTPDAYGTFHVNHRSQTTWSPK